MVLLRYFFFILILPFWFAVSGCTSQSENETGSLLTVLHTNDHHGAYWENKSGSEGLVNRYALIEHIRQEVASQGGTVLLLDAGDVNTGTPESDLLLAEPDFKGMARIGYDAMTLGNHEFDHPLNILQQQQAWAGFPFLSANIYDSRTGQRAFTPYTILQKDHLKIGVLGLTTVDTKVVGSKQILANLDFRPPVTEAKKALAEMRKAKPDVVIVLSHQGYYYNGSHGSSAPGDVTLARQLPSGSVDLIVGGHSHTAVCLDGGQLDADWRKKPTCQPDYQNGIWIVQALDSGHYLGRADFHLKAGKLTLLRYQLLPVDAPEGDRPANVQAVYTLLESMKKPVDMQLAAPLGRVSHKLEGDRDQVRNHQTNLGQLIVQSQIEKTGADFGIISSGSIRSSIAAGPVSYRDVLKSSHLAIRLPLLNSPVRKSLII